MKQKAFAKINSSNKKALYKQTALDKAANITCSIIYNGIKIGRQS